MKQSVNEYEFVKAFDDYNRSNSFSVEGRKALFDWIEQLDEDCGTDTELDVISICCEFTEYESFEELQGDYDSIETMEDLQDNTIVIPVGEEGLIIQQF
jgi:hypothetical protein